MALLMQVVIVDGASSTTLCHGVGYRDSTHWAYLECQLPADYAFQVSMPIRAAFATPLGRVTASPKIMLRVCKLYDTPEAAIAARLLLPANAPLKGTITISVATTGSGVAPVVCSNCALDACHPVTTGCTLTVEWTYKCGAVAAGS